jgi:thermopsin
MRRSFLMPILLALLMSVSALAVVGGPATGLALAAPTPTSTILAETSHPVGGSSGPSAPTPTFCSSARSTANDPAYAAFVDRIDSAARGALDARVPGAASRLPYTGAYADQSVGGVAMAGSQIAAACTRSQPTNSQTAPTGVAYDGQTDVNGIRDVTLDSNSVAGILTVRAPPNDFYPGSGTPTTWGAQENVVLPNVTLFGSECPAPPCNASGVGNYAFWVQNVISYDSHNQTLSLVDDTWNFTSYSSDMLNSSLVSWSPNGGNYTGTWVAFSPYYHIPTPFTVTAYVNTSVNAAGDQVLWYNYSIATPTHFYGNGNYDYLVFHSQRAGHRRLALVPPDFEASASLTHVVTEGYEFDAFIGADDGSNQLMLAANATMQVQYCTQIPSCTSAHFAYANVPAAVNFGSQTGEETVGIAVNYVGATAYLSAGPLILHGLWNFTGEPGVAPGATPVVNAISVHGDPEGRLASQPYAFVFFENKAFRAQGFQWAPDQPSWDLMPGTYHYQVLLADYTPRSGTIVVGSSPTTLNVSLAYRPSLGVYTPLWAFGDAQLAGIALAGNGSLANPFALFHNPTTGAGGFAAGELSPLFFSLDDYAFASFPGVLIDGTQAHLDLDAPPTFGVLGFGTTQFYLGLEFFETSNLTLAHDALVQGWPAWDEISFYQSVPASQNPAPQAEVFVWNSTHDLILSNQFVATAALRGQGFTPPDALVLYGGTDNVVWGNTFTDPVGVPLHLRGPYAGIGLGEGGDLLYNNNFSVDNPVVYLPYNWANVADCLPQSLGGCANPANNSGWYYNTAANVVGSTWNVSPQAASNVVHTVNGFPLSGNVLGPSVGTQGGNYYWNYGSSPNNLSTRPYVSGFYYSDWSEIFPLGCGSIQAAGAPCGTPPPRVGAYEDGITAGGDDAPYGPTVNFTESGLPTGTLWVVLVGSGVYVTHASAIRIALPYGSYGFMAIAPGWTAHPASGTLFASGALSVSITFHRLILASTNAAGAIIGGPSDAAGPDTATPAAVRFV